MLEKFAGIGLRGKRAEEHDDDEEAKAAKSAEEHEDDEEEAKAEEHDDEDDEDEKEAKAVARGVKRGRAAAVKIVNLCAVAGRSAKVAAEFLASGASQAEVSETLLACRAEGSGTGGIAGQTGPVDGDAYAAWDRSIARVQGRYSAGQSA